MSRCTIAGLVLLVLGIPGPVLAQSSVLSPNGKHLAAIDGKAVTLSDAQTQKVLVRFVGHTDTVTSLGFSPNGKMLVSGGKDRLVMLWDLATAKQMRSFKLRQPVTSVSFGQERNTLFVRDSEGTISEFDVATGKLRRVKETKEKAK